MKLQHMNASFDLDVLESAVEFLCPCRPWKLRYFSMMGTLEIKENKKNHRQRVNSGNR